MKLKKLEVNAFAGINPNSPVIIDFTQSKFVLMEGDEGKGKTSMIKSLLVACGQLSKDNKDLVNLDSGKIDINLDFVGKDGYTYNVRVTKSSFILSYEGEAMPEPISKMKELLGVVGVSPMEIKYKPLKEIVKWLATYSNKSPEEFEAQMAKHKINVKKAQDTRAMANKSAKALTEYLNGEDLYVNWEASEKKFKKNVDVKELSQKLDAAGKASDKYIQAKSRLQELILQKGRLQEQIEKLTEELERTSQSVGTGIKYIEDNKAVIKEYDTIKKEYDNAAAASVQFNKWQDIKRKKTELDDFESISQQADATEKEILQKVTKLKADILPDIKGVSLVMQDTHEEGEQVKEGLYWNGKNFAQLSESEVWDLCLLIWRKYKVKVVVVDNYSSLGSQAAALLQKLSDDGAFILAAEMNREVKTLQINY